MTDVFGAMLTRFDTNNNSATNSSSNSFQSRSSSNLELVDRAMIQLNNYSSIDYNSNSQNVCAFPDKSANCFYEEHSPQNKPETIHSGHFMVSEIDDADNEVIVEDASKGAYFKEDINIKKDDREVVEIKAIINQSKNFNFKQFKKNWNIDYPKSQPSLDSLFKKMNLGFDSKLTSPKWKQFPGLKISLKAKIRVNNLIWRAWHIKYVLGKTPPINPFPPQLDTDQFDNNHIYVAHRPEVMKIGKFFSKKIVSQDFIALEYTKWRRYYKEIIQKQKNQLNNPSHQWNSYESFNNQYDNNSNDQFSMGAWSNPINNYSSAQLGYHAEFMQPDFSYGIQAEFMDTFEEPSLQSFLTQKNSFLPTLIEEEPIIESPKLQQDLSLQQQIYPTNSMNTELNYDQQQQMQPISNQINNQISNQINNQLNNQLNNNLQQSTQQIPTSSVNYDYINYQQPMMQQQNQSNQISYRTNYAPNLSNQNNLLLDQQNNVSSNLSNNLNNQSQSSSNCSSTTHQANNVMLSIENNQLSNNSNLNSNNQLNNGQFIVPNKPSKQKIRSRSVSSLPQQQQIQLQRQHMNENSSSLMEINQPILTNQSTFHNTTSNLLTTQHQATSLQNSTTLSNQNSSLSTQNSLEQHPQMLPERTNNYIVQHRNALNHTMMMNNQLMQHNSNQLNNQLQTTMNNQTTNYFNMNLNNMNSIANNQTAQQANSSLSLDYVDRNMRNSSSNHSTSTSYFPLQINNSSNTSTQSIQTNSNLNQNNDLNTNLNSNYNLSKYQTSQSPDTGTNLISQLLCRNTTKLGAGNLSSNLTGNLSSNLNSQINNASFKRNSTGTYPNVQYGSLQDQFNNSTVSSSSVTDLVMNSTNVNSNLNSTTNNSSLNELNNYQNNQLIRKTSNLANLQSNQSFSASFNNSSIMNDSNLSNSNMNNQLVNQSQSMLSNDNLICQQSISNKHNSSNLTSSLENLNNKNSSTKTHRIKREHHRKLSTGKLRASPSNLIRSNSNKSINIHSPVSPTTSLQTTLLNQQAKLSSPNNEIFNFNNRNNLLLANNNLNSNLNTTSSLSSTPNLQSSLANSSFASVSLNDYSNDSIYSPSSPFGFNQNLSNSQLNKSQGSFKSSQSSTNPIHSPSNLVKNERDPSQYKEHRRVCHINAEQKRRCNIKHGFDTLRAILPSISSNNNTKISKASMLQKGAEHIRQLRIEQETQQDEIERLRAQIEGLNQTIGLFQNQLPASGAPISGMRPGQIRERFEDYVRNKTNQNWKFWMFSIIMEPLLDSYNNTIPTTNYDELTSSVLRWLDQSCNLINLRREVLNSLRIISTSTNVLVNPQSLAEESLVKVQKKSNKKKK